ncbi:MAG TPA: LysM peptidoglycan-binding domain-containing protein [Prolixibacteraceae bacterium]|jgi:LysM repeat protein/ABC-type branched-subunit amino acid transport system substrate-binding protein
MKLFISICFFAVFILNAQPGFSQKEIEISGKKYLLYTVKKGETAYGLCQQYKVTQAELKEANPDLTAILKSGSTVKIPVRKEGAEIKPKPILATTVAAEPEYYYHKVAKKQTIFSIAKQYGITANELIRYNPEITNGLVVGVILKVPVKPIEPTNSSIQPKIEGGGIKAVLPDTKPEVGFINHTVTGGETLYSLEQKYGVTSDELMRLNPSLENGLQIGARLKIKQHNQQVTTKEQAVSSFEKYKVEKGETLFSLATRFGVEVSELKKANPTLFERSLETGETILIPKYSSSTNKTNAALEPATGMTADVSKDTVNGNCNPASGIDKHKYKIGLLLPLYLSGNDQINPSQLNEDAILKQIDFSKQLNAGNTDSVAVTSGINIDPKAESFLEFYEGVVLAIDSLQRKGMNIELCVFDASNQKMINGLLQLDVFRELDLIIGPIYPELQTSVASFAAKNRIPMVSPLASTGNYEENNPYYFKVNPSKEYQIEQTAQYIAREFKDKNFILLPMTGNSSSTDARLAELGKERLLAARQSTKTRKDLFHEYSFQQQGLNSVKPLMDESGENVFMIPSDNEAQVSVAVTNLNALAENYNIVLIGTSNLPKLKSIQTENYHHVRLRYLSPTFVDYKKPLVRRFIAQYRDTFSGEPSQFSHQGFDVSFYFLSALNRFGKDFRNCLPEYPMELTQTNFSFRRVTPMGGYMNQSLFVTAYERNYDIVNYDTLVSDPK